MKYVILFDTPTGSQKMSMRKEQVSALIHGAYSKAKNRRENTDYRRRQREAWEAADMATFLRRAWSEGPRE